MKIPCVKEVPVKTCTVEWVCPRCGCHGNCLENAPPQSACAGRRADAAAEPHAGPGAHQVGGPRAVKPGRRRGNSTPSGLVISRDVTGGVAPSCRPARVP